MLPTKLGAIGVNFKARKLNSCKLYPCICTKAEISIKNFPKGLIVFQNLVTHSWTKYLGKGF